MSRQQRRQQERQRAKVGLASPPTLPATPDLGPDGRRLLECLVEGTVDAEGLGALDAGEALAVVQHSDAWLTRYLAFIDDQIALGERTMRRPVSQPTREQLRQGLDKVRAVRAGLVEAVTRMRALLPAP